MQQISLRAPARTSVPAGSVAWEKARRAEIGLGSDSVPRGGVVPSKVVYGSKPWAADPRATEGCAMSEPSPSAADRNLLFGVLALQMDFIDRDALVAAMNAWVLRKDQPLRRLL